jgi:hypothetical protein
MVLVEDIQITALVDGVHRPKKELVALFIHSVMAVMSALEF